MRGALLALVLLLGTLVPQAVQAHGGHAHKAAPPAAATPAAPAATPQRAPAASDEVSPLCPPGGGSGHVCGCGNLSVCDGRIHAPVAVASRALNEAAAVSQRLAASPAAAPAPRLPFRAASPRAPPLFS